MSCSAGVYGSTLFVYTKYIAILALVYFALSATRSPEPGYDHLALIDARERPQEGVRALAHAGLFLMRFRVCAFNFCVFRVRS